MKNNFGITIVELLLVIVIIGLSLAVVFPVGAGFLGRNNLQNTSNEVVSSLRTAQLNSLSSKDGSEWGVHITTSQIIMFPGKTYTPPGTSFDQKYEISPSLTVTPSDIYFSKLNGLPNQTVIITLQNNFGQSRVISVNAEGSIDVN